MYLEKQFTVKSLVCHRTYLNHVFREDNNRTRTRTREESYTRLNNKNKQCVCVLDGEQNDIESNIEC